MSKQVMSGETAAFKSAALVATLNKEQQKALEELVDSIQAVNEIRVSAMQRAIDVRDRSHNAFSAEQCVCVACEMRKILLRGLRLEEAR